MRAALLRAPRRVELVDVPTPEPGSGQVRVRVEGCGVCGSNLPLWEGREWFRYPLAPGEPGHEGWGTVDALGPGVDGLVPGQRVAMISQRAFAEFDVADADTVLPLPSALDHVPFPAEPLGCAMNVFGRSRIRAGDTVAVVGVGFLGALLVRLAAGAGARVFALSRRRTSLEVAAAMGAEEIDDLGSEGEARAWEWSGGAGFDRVIEATGHQAPLDLAGRLTRVRGRLVIAGYHQEPRTIDLRLWNWRGLDVVNAHERDPAAYREGMRAAVEAACAGRIDPRPLLTHRFSLPHLADALTALGERPPSFLKAIWVP